MSNVENVLKHDDFFPDTVDTLKKGVGLHRKRECLKGVINKIKVYLLGGKKQ